MDGSIPGSSVHGVFQARILKQVISSSKDHQKTRILPSDNLQKLCVQLFLELFLFLIVWLTFAFLLLFLAFFYFELSEYEMLWLLENSGGLKSG